MQSGWYEQLLSTIYDAATDGKSWSTALEGIADATGSAGCVLRIHDERSGRASAIAPRSDPEFLKSYAQCYWRHNILARKSVSLRPGQVITLPELLHPDEFRATRFYNEWWRPQGVGVHALCSNLLVEKDRTAVLTIQKRLGGDQYETSDVSLVRALTPHLIRALEISRRLALAKSLPDFDRAAGSNRGLAVVDGEGRLLIAGPRTRKMLQSVGCLKTRGNCESVGGGLDHLVSRVCDLANPPSKVGSIGHRLPDGRALRMTISYCAEGTISPDRPQLDRPAALIELETSEESRTARAELLIDRFGLTPREALVAVEIARGDGRGAVAARLGIKPTTVRSHLENVFSKMNVHRQAELAKIVAKL